MKKYALWLVSWYPGKADPFDGDFIERHAKAVAALGPVVVIFISKDNSLPTGKSLVQVASEGNLLVYRGYYARSPFSFLEKLVSVSRYFFLQKKIFSIIKKERGLPDLVHVHVAFKAGLLARYLKGRYNIPFIISEHWSGYYPKSSNNILKESYINIQLRKLILQGASLILPVANKLGESIRKFSPAEMAVIPNVVDTDLFYYKPASLNKFRFIHPSGMSHVKNPEGIIRAAIELYKEGFDFELLMVGRITESLQEMAEKSGGLDNYLFLKKEVSYASVAKEMQQSSVLVLFSRFESLPCVILEALCCGLPVISTDVGGIKEVIDETNGVLIESENEDQLKNKMKEMIINYDNYDRGKIAEDASSKFNYSTVGASILKIYEKVLNKE